MKAAWCERQGTARDVLRVGEMEDPHPAVAKCGLAAPYVLRCGRHVHQPIFVLFERGRQPLDDPLGDGVGKRIEGERLLRYSKKSGNLIPEKK